MSVIKVSFLMSVLSYLTLCLANSTVAVAGVEIDLPAAPPVVETWSLQEIWRLGGEDADESEPLLGVISRGVVDDEGRVLLLDSQLAHVLEFSSDGQFLRTIGRPGEGPGELQRPQDLTLMSDGTIGLLQGYPSRIVRLNRDGTPAGDIAGTDPAINLWRVRSQNGVTVVVGQRNDYNRKDPTRSVTYRFLRSLDQDGQVKHIYLDGTATTQWQPPVSDESKGYFPSFNWDLTPEGLLILAPHRDQYLLQIIDPDGAVVRTVKRPFKPYRRNRADRQKVSDRMTMTSNGKKLEVKKIILDTEPAIRSVMACNDGTIWVESCFGRRNLPAGVFRRYDVLDHDGNLLKEVRLLGDVRSEEDGFWPLADGRFMWVRNLTSAYRSMYPSSAASDDEGDDDTGDVMLAVIILAPHSVKSRNR